MASSALLSNHRNGVIFCLSPIAFSPSSSVAAAWVVRGSRATPEFCKILSVSALLQLGAQFLFALSELRREGLAKVLRGEHLADFDFGLALMRVGAAFHPVDGFIKGGDLPYPEASDQLLGLGERAIRDHALGAGKFDARTLGAGLQAFAREHDAGLH